MSDVSPILALPLIQPSQAQKHVTHNEALRILDALVQPVVATRGQNAPPASPLPGERHVVGDAPTGAWAGQPRAIALYEETGWAFLAPQPGWTVEVLAGPERLRFDGAAWIASADEVLRVAELGVNATPDLTNRLSVSSPATLLNHEGAGHQLKLNKAAASDTASLLFQTGFSGRAEMGTTGSDDFTVKVSADGSTFKDGLRVEAASGRAALPNGASVASGSAAAPGLAFEGDADTGLLQPGPDQIALATGGVQRAVLGTTGLQLDLPLSGLAVTQSATDATAGRLMKVADFGLGQTANPAPIPTDGSTIGSGFYRSSTTEDNVYGTEVALARIGWSNLRQVEFGAAVAGSTIRFLGRTQLADNAWGGIVEFFHQQSILGTVSQTGGVPTGRLIEAGSNANGTYRRFACGLQLCWRTNLSAANANTAIGALFRSASVTWTYPVAFAASPAVKADADDGDAWVTTAAPGTASVALRVLSPVTKGSALPFRAMAIGTWFV